MVTRWVSEEIVDTGIDYLRRIDRVGDCTNFDHKVDVNSSSWKTEYKLNGWRLQRRNRDSKTRIVDRDGLQRGNGSFEVMKEKLVRLTSDSFLFPGDVIGVRRGLYDHYAVYIGEDKVIQYSGEGGDFKGKVSIHVATMKDFLKMNKSYYVISFIHEVPVRIYADTNFVAGETYGLERWKADKVYSPEETVKRAMSRLGEAEYNLVFNNCEHFVMWCKTGIGWSLQVEKKVEDALNIADYLLMKLIERAETRWR